MAKSLLFVLLLLPFAAFSQWQRLPGPSPDFSGEAGNVTCIASNDTFVWIGTLGGGIFRNTSAAFSSWEAKNTGLKTYTVFSILYNNSRLVCTTNNGVYISQDKGDTWTAINTGLPLGQNITSFGAADGVLWAGTEKYGIFKSTDNGQHWDAANQGLLDNYVVDIKTTENDVWALTRNAGLFGYDSAAHSWMSINVPGGCTACLNMAVVDSSIFIADGSLLYSHDKGKNWQRDTNVKDLKGITAYHGLLMAYNLYRVYDSYDTGKTWAIDWEFNIDSAFEVNTALNTQFGVIKYIGTKKHGIYRGQVAAVTWKPFNFGLLTADIWQIEWNKNKLYTVAFSQLYESADRGITWNSVGFSAPQTVTSFLITDNKILVSTAEDGVYTSPDDFHNWQQSNTGLDKRVDKLLKRGNDIYALTKNGIYRSATLGQQWTKYCDNIDTLQFTDILFDGNILYATTNKGLYKSTSDGASFTYVSGDIPKLYAPYIRKVNGKIWLKVGIETFVSPDGIIWPRYYYVDYGAIFAQSFTVVGNQLYASTGTGFLFKNITDEKFSYLNSIDGLYANVFQKNDSFLYAGTSAGLWRLPLTSVVLGINPAAGDKINIYPNPAQNLVTIEGAEPSQIELYNLSGQKLDAYKNSTTIDVSGLPAGVYLLKVTTSDGNFVKKVVKE